MEISRVRTPSTFVSIPGIDKEASDFMIQNSFTSTAQFSVALTYDRKRRLTSALVHSLSENEINHLIQDVIAHRENVALPTLLPTLLLAFRVSSASTKVRDCHQRIVEIEHETGIRTNFHPNQQCCAVHQKQSAGVNRYDAINFDRVTDELTSLSSKLAYCEYICEVHLPMLVSFNRINSRLVGSASGENKDRLSGVEARLLMETNFLQASLQGILVWTRYLSKRSQAQVQTVRPTSHLRLLATHTYSAIDIQPDCAKGQCSQHAGQRGADDNIGGSKANRTRSKTRQRSYESHLSNNYRLPPCNFHLCKLYIPESSRPCTPCARMIAGGFGRISSNIGPNF